MDFDVNYLKRAENLVRDAKKKAHSNKTGVAWKNYKADGPLKRLAIVTGGSFAVSATSAIIGSVALGAGIAASAVTFGIAPAVSIVLTYGLAKAGMELAYQSKSKQLKKGIEGEEDDLHIDDPSLLVPAMAKVLKKWTRVHRRAVQLGVEGKGRNAATTARHFVTSMRGGIKNTKFGRKYLVTSEETMFSNIGHASKDHELSDRLYELRFYAQMLFNYVRKLVDDVAVAERNGVVDMCELGFANVVKQVHFTGAHTTCKNCYGMSDADVKRRLAEFERASKAAPTPVSAHVRGGPATNRQQGTSGSMGVDEARAREFFSKLGVARVDGSASLTSSMQVIQNKAKGTELSMEKTWNDTLTKQGFRGAQLTPFASGGKAAIEKSGNYAKGAAKSAIGGTSPNIGAVVGTTALNAGAGALAGGAFAELTLTVKNRLTRRSVLRRRGHAFDLLAGAEEARNSAIRDFEALLAKTDITKRGMRVATKCASYVTKLTDIKKTLQPSFQKLPADLSGKSGFGSCDEAYQFAYGMHYYFRNAEKFIAFLVYLEAILIDIDLKVAKLGIGVDAGRIVNASDEVVHWPQPKTVKSVKK